MDPADYVTAFLIGLMLAAYLAWMVGILRRRNGGQK